VLRLHRSLFLRVKQNLLNAYHQFRDLDVLSLIGSF